MDINTNNILSVIIKLFILHTHNILHIIIICNMQYLCVTTTYILAL